MSEKSSYYKRPGKIDEVLDRNSRWQSKIVSGWYTIAVYNSDLKPVNSSQAAHDRKTLCEYALKLERAVRTFQAQFEELKGGDKMKKSAHVHSLRQGTRYR